MATAPTGDLNYLKVVREQYENLPYPPRNPEEEKTKFFYYAASALDCMNHYHFAGKRDFSKGFRALVAGGGTGDSTIMLAEQLRGWDAEIVHLDISSASLEIARSRAKVRGLDNITWIHDSLLNAPKILQKQFDYIDCTGVLHHLESPEAGLAALTAVLKDDGVMGIMLYAKYGREGVYQIQNLMRILNQGEYDMQRKIENCKSALNYIPTTNSYKQMQHVIMDGNQMGDAGIYDLFLHSNDIAYSVPEVYDFLATSNLELTHFFFNQSLMGNDLYRLEFYTSDGAVSHAVNKLSVAEKYAAAELIHGRMLKHTFYASKKKTSVPTIDNMDYVPFFSMLVGKETYDNLNNFLKSVQLNYTINCNIGGIEVKLTKTANVERILALIDGTRSIREIVQEVQKSFAPNEKKPTVEELNQEFRTLYAAFNLQDWMLLKEKGLPMTKTISDIMSRFKNP